MSSYEFPQSIENALLYGEPQIAGLRPGETRPDHTGKLQVYLGGDHVDQLTHYGHEQLRNGAIDIEMYTIDGRDDIDYAQITIKPKMAGRTPLERSIAIRTGANGKPTEYIERTPVQHFTSPRQFMDIPLSGRAHWLATDPQGNVFEGLFDDRTSAAPAQAVTFSDGWTFVWIVEGSRPFVFAELCTPPFISESADCSEGTAGIIELETAELRAGLLQEFLGKLATFTHA